MTSFQETRTERAAEIEPTDFAGRLNVLVKAICVEETIIFVYGVTEWASNSAIKSNSNILSAKRKTLQT